MRKSILRYLSFALVVISLISLLVVPASAVSNNSGVVGYSPLYIETVEFGDTGIYQSWVFNECQEGSIRATSEFYNYRASGNLQDGSFQGDISYLSFGDSTDPMITFRSARSQIIELDDLESFTLGFSGAFNQGNVFNGYFECYIWIPVINNTTMEWNLVRHTAANVFRNEDYSIPIGALIGDTISTLLDGNNLYVIISDLEIGVTALNMSFIESGFEVYYDVSDPPSPNAWMDDVGITANEDIENPLLFDITEWLAKSVGAFLHFEFAPGFSIDMIFGVVIVIAFVFFIITLLI